MLKWSQRSQPGVRRLFEQLQDLDIYVEDEGDEAFYSKLFRRIVTDKLRVERVYALNGRSSVIEKCKTYDFSRRKALFIIDGDLDFTKGVPPPLDSPYLHRLDSYCIENKILCKEAIKKIITEETDFDPDTIDSILDIEAWHTELRRNLPDLFAALATLHCFAPHLPTVHAGLGNILEQIDRASVLSLRKVEQVRAAALKAAKEHATADEVDRRFLEISHHIESLNDTLDCVSGKDFLLPLLRLHLSSKTCSVGQKSLRRRLSMNCDVEPFKNLLHHMQEIVTLH
jgi:hypothetical protein